MVLRTTFGKALAVLARKEEQDSVVETEVNEKVDEWLGKHFTPLPVRRALDPAGNPGFREQDFSPAPETRPRAGQLHKHEPSAAGGPSAHSIASAVQSEPPVIVSDSLVASVAAKLKLKVPEWSIAEGIAKDLGRIGSNMEGVLEAVDGRLKDTSMANLSTQQSKEIEGLCYQQLQQWELAKASEPDIKGCMDIIRRRTANTLAHKHDDKTMTPDDSALLEAVLDKLWKDLAPRAVTRHSQGLVHAQLQYVTQLAERMEKLRQDVLDIRDDEPIDRF